MLSCGKVNILIHLMLLLIVLLVLQLFRSLMPASNRNRSIIIMVNVK